MSESRPKTRVVGRPYTKVDGAAKVAVKVIDAVSQPYGIEGRIVRVTTSAGIGIYPDHGEDADTLMKSADVALYEAKRAGKNAYRTSERRFTTPVPKPSEKRSA